jgi:hypothetical protein
MWDEFTTEDGDTFYVDSNGQTHWEKPTTKFYENAMKKKEKKEKKEKPVD